MKKLQLTFSPYSSARYHSMKNMTLTQHYHTQAYKPLLLLYQIQMTNLLCDTYSLYTQPGSVNTNCNSVEDQALRHGISPLSISVYSLLVKGD